MTRHLVRAGVASLALAALLGPAGAPSAQPNPHPITPDAGPASLPSGPGTIRGVVLDEDAPGQTAGLTVALYALQADGTPGLGSAETRANGHFVFEGVADDPSIVYLVGVRYAGIPWGERTAFVSGQQEIDLVLRVRQPTADASRLRVRDTSLRFEVLGTQIAVEEVHELENPGEAPIWVPEDARSGPAPFAAVLPAGATRFQTGLFNDTASFERQGDRVMYWGPLYSGRQEVRFGYQLPVEPGADRVRIATRFPRGSTGVRIRTPAHGPRIESPALRPGEPGDEDGEDRVWIAGPQPPGGGFELSLAVPETENRPEAITLQRAELAVELDDTVLEVTESVQLQVAPGASLAGRAGDPLLRFELPPRAELTGLSADADPLGITAVEQGIDVIGPLPPGPHEFAFRYRLPAGPEGATLDLRFPRTLSSLLLRTADTGLVIESERLHRLRPQAMGTRTWMLREAFHVEPHEIVSVRFLPIEAPGSSPAAGLFFVVAAAGLVLLFVVAPLRRTRRVRGREQDDLYGAAHERELVYATIRDLEHDFETGKVSQEDFERSREELWSQAVELMRQERAGTLATGEDPGAGEPEAASPRPGPTRTAVTGSFCPGCGKPVEPGWRFCSHCGGTLAPAGEGAEHTG